MRRLAAAVAVLSVVSAAVLVQDEEAKKLEVKPDASVASVLKAQTGESVILVLSSGADLAGKVVMVGDKVVHVTRIRGMEFYDAVVALDQVVAVKIRVKTQ